MALELGKNWTAMPKCKLHPLNAGVCGRRREHHEGLWCQRAMEEPIEPVPAHANDRHQIGTTPRHAGARSAFEQFDEELEVCTDRCARQLTCSGECDRVIERQSQSFRLNTDQLAQLRLAQFAVFKCEQEMSRNGRRPVFRTLDDSHSVTPATGSSSSPTVYHGGPTRTFSARHA